MLTSAMHQKRSVDAKKRNPVHETTEQNHIYPSLLAEPCLAMSNEL